MIYKVMKTVVYEYHIDCDSLNEALVIADSYGDDETFNRYFSKSFVIHDHEMEALNA